MWWPPMVPVKPPGVVSMTASRFPAPSCASRIPGFGWGGPMIAHGYRNAPEHEAFSRPGWFATSDSGTLVAGRLQITGRLDTIIVSGGLKLHPEVLEQALLEIPGVTGACVVGIAHERLGQAIVAAYRALPPGRGDGRVSRC